MAEEAAGWGVAVAVTPERHRKISALFQAAAELDSEARAAFLVRECGEDAELRREVEDLLEVDAEDFVVDAPRLGAAPVRQEDLTGKTLARYRIAEKIGEGGMSTVYRAQDTKLGRTVALKFLAPELLRSEQARARFVREARASAALDHPNICTTYDLEQVEGHSFIAMAYLEGRTLAERLREGRVPIREAVDIARQTARGLEAAHANGVVHRDVKPANVMLLDQGVAKVMDFGVAWLEQSETLTQAGMTMGTVAYMAPEQVEGGDVDRRCDIWALGAVLYEALTGRPPFDRATAREALAAIRGAEPAPVREVREDTPAALAAIVGRCLHKDPAERYPNAGVLASELEDVHDQLRTQEITAENPQTPKVGARGIALGWAAAVLALAGLVLALKPREEAPPPALVARNFTSFPGFETEPAISPDGTRIAFAWDGGKPGQTDIYVQLIGSFEPLQITATPDSERNPVWSPDGTKLAFLRRHTGDPTSAASTIYITPALGGPETRLASVVANPRQTVIDWSPDGSALVASDNGLIVLLPVDTAESGDADAPVRIGDDGYGPRFDATGERVAFTRERAEGGRELMVVSVSGEELLRHSISFRNLDWSPSGEDLILSGDASITQLRLADGSVRTTPVGGAFGLSSIDVRGSRIAMVKTIQNANVWAVDLRAGPSEQPQKRISSSAEQDTPSYSPDGERIAFSSNRSGMMAVWLCQRDGSGARMLTGFETRTGSPRWSPDGRTIVLDSREGGEQENSPQIWTVDVDSGRRRQLTSRYRNVMPSFSPDGEWVYYGSFRDNRPEIYRMRRDGGESEQLTHDVGWEAFVGADGRYVYYSRPGSEVTLSRLDLKTREVEGIPEVGNAGSIRYWALAKDGVYFVDTRTEPEWVQYLDLATRQTRRVTPIGALMSGPAGLAVSPDGETLLYAQVDEYNSDIVLIEGLE